MQGAIPAERGIVIVGAGVDHAVIVVMMGQVLAVVVRIKRKL